MPRKSTRTASGSSPEKAAATSRRNTRRGQKNNEEIDSEVVDEIPRHLLKASDESSEQSDNDSDYGSPKKSRGRGRGRGRKAKEPIIEEKEKQTSTRPRRGRRGVAQSPIPEEQHSQDYQESANSQTTNDEQDASTMDSTTLEKEKTPEPESVDNNSDKKQEEEPVVDDPVSETKETEAEKIKAKIEDSKKVEKIKDVEQNQPEKENEKIKDEGEEKFKDVEEKEKHVTEQIETKPPTKEIEPKEQRDIEESEEIVKEKVSEVTIEQDLQSNNDKEPVNEEVKADNQDESNDGGDDKNVENKDHDMSSRDDEIVSAEIDDKHESLVDDEVSKEAPELPMEDQNDSRSRSRSNSSDKMGVKQRSSRSSSGEIHEDSVEKMDVDDSIEIQNKKKESPVKSVRKVDRKSPPKSAGDEKPIQRKRKWGARKTDDEPVIAITTDSLKNVIAEEVKPVDVKLASSPSPEPEEKRQRVKLTSEDRDVKKKLLKERLRKQEEEEDRRNEQIAKAIERSQVSPTIVVTNGAGKERKVSVINSEEHAAPPTPPKNQVSRVICITNLVRPLTFLAVKSLVARTGKIEDFWIDAIKSKCFVVYKTEDEAVETRHALHGVKWPEHNLKTLNVEFSTEEEMNKIIEATRGERIPNESSGRETKLEKSFGWSKQDSHPDDRSRNSRRVREWDVGKKEEAERDDDRESRRRRRSSEQREKVVKRRSVSKSPVREEQKDTTPVPQQRLLDDLFRKTKALPFIYWMPLSEERIKELEEQRLKNIAEHNRRMEEMLKIQKERREAREQRMREEEKRREEERKNRDRRRSRRRSRERSRDRSDRNRRYDRR